MTLTFAIRVKTNIPSKFQALPNYQLFSTKGHGDADHDLCPQHHLLVRTNISTKFEGPTISIAEL